MRLIIAEKPSLARAIADGIGRPQRRIECGFIQIGDTIIAHAAGHIMKACEPSDYDEKYKHWRTDALPIKLPKKWKVTPDENKQELFNALKTLILQADEVVNAGDPDREGQLLIDEIINYCKYKGTVTRLLINDTNESAVQKALKEMPSNEEYKPLYDAALSRQEADWTCGMSLSRLFSLTVPRDDTRSLSIGRVITPTLAIVVKRDLEIENFVPKPFYSINGVFTVTNGEFTAKWQPSEDSPFLDEKNRILDKTVIEKLRQKLHGGSVGRIVSYTKKEAKSNPPLLHCMSSCQTEVSKKQGCSVEEVTQALQTLYEKKFTTYPRTRCEYATDAIYENHTMVLPRVLETLPDSIANFVMEIIEQDKKSKAFNDAKVVEHHAIVPTGTIPHKSELTEVEQAVYDAIVARYIVQFLPPQLFEDVKAEVEIEKELFKAHSKTCSSLGWKVLYAKDEEPYTEETEEEEETQTNALPPMTLSEPAGLRELTQTEKKTTPPERFTEGSLINVMANVQRYTEDARFREILKETSGIGTEATRTEILKRLYAKEYIEKKGKSIISTQMGRDIIAVVPQEIKSVELTALWEEKLSQIVSREFTKERFLEEQENFLEGLTKNWLSSHPPIRFRREWQDTRERVKCPFCKQQKMIEITSRKTGVKFWKCEACSEVLYATVRGKMPKTHRCLKCDGIISRMRRRDESGYYWRCHKNRDHFFIDDNGTPREREQYRGY